MSTENEENSVEERKRCSTGISGLDFQLGGGFPAGTTIVIFGHPLVGIDKMARQFWKADEEGSSYLMFDSVIEEGMTECGDSSLDTLLSHMKGTRVVVDSLSTVIRDQGVDAAVELITNGAREIVENEGNALFVMYRGVHDIMDEIRISRAADVFISLAEEIHGNEMERKLFVHKIRYMDVPSRAYPFNIMEEGLELSTTARVV